MISLRAVVCVIILCWRSAESFHFKSAAPRTGLRELSSPLKVGSEGVPYVVIDEETTLKFDHKKRKQRGNNGRIGAAVVAFVVGFSNLGLNRPVDVAFAADSGGSAHIVYKSGKTPDKMKNKDSSNKKGTRKDTSFLRCMSNCKSDCQKPGEGLAKSDCNQDCQDQCCTSYEQCSFRIRIKSNDI